MLFVRKTITITYITRNSKYKLNIYLVLCRSILREIKQYSDFKKIKKIYQLDLLVNIRFIFLLIRCIYVNNHLSEKCNSFLYFYDTLANYRILNGNVLSY